MLSISIHGPKIAPSPDLDVQNMSTYKLLTVGAIARSSPFFAEGHGGEPQKLQLQALQIHMFLNVLDQAQRDQYIEMFVDAQDKVEKNNTKAWRKRS